jgi:hypothetical protein
MLLSRMRGDPSRTSRTAESEGRNSPSVAQSNGSLALHSNSPQADTPLHSPGVNGISSSTAMATPSQQTRATSSYSSVLASQPASTPSPSSPVPAVPAVPDTTTSLTPDKPFKYTRDEMLNIWKANAARFRGSGIPLEFEKHEAFTSEDPLEPTLLTEMTSAEKEVCIPGESLCRY